MKNVCRLFVLFLAVSALAPIARAHTDSASATTAVTGVRAFQLRANEVAGREFVRTPSFAWTPMKGVQRYEFELATSRTFTPNAVVWRSGNLKTPATAIPISLPWITGAPYSLYAHVRAITAAGVGPWSTPYGFNMRWPGVARPLGSYPGLVRWTPVEGASGYQVWFVDAHKIFATSTNVADEREYYTFHQNSTWTRTVHWRVRAERFLYGSTTNGLPAVSYGPWSPTYASTNPDFVHGPLATGITVSDVVGGKTAVHKSHALMPGFMFSGDTAGGKTEPLYRVYVYTDRDCVNLVYKGAVVGGPAYAPRRTGPLKLPANIGDLVLAQGSYLPDGAEGATFTADFGSVTTTEDGSTAAAGSSGDTSGGTGGSTGGGSTGGGSGSTGSTGATSPAKAKVDGAHIDLWDEDFTGGGYYWTVVPVEMVFDSDTNTTLAADAAKGSTKVMLASAAAIAAGDSLEFDGESALVESVSGNVVTLKSGLDAAHSVGEIVKRPGGGIKYYDVQVGQDACYAGQIGGFGKTSTPTVAASTAPFATGMSTNGRLVAATHSNPVFYGAPLVSWLPAPAAIGYEIQWSKKTYPWASAGHSFTFSTSALLTKLKPGTWYYRVRGFDPLIPGPATQMTWSSPSAIRVAAPIFKIVSS